MVCVTEQLCHTLTRICTIVVVVAGCQPAMYQMICSLKVAAIASTGQLCRRRQPSMHRAPLMLGADWICCRTQDGCSKLTGRQAQASGHRQHR